MLATNINEQGNVMLYFARLMVIILSSNGCRNTSKVCLLNSGNSSQKSTP